MKAKELQEKIKQKSELLESATKLRDTSAPGSIAYDVAIKLIEINEEEINYLENLLRVEQAGGEII